MSPCLGAKAFFNWSCNGVHRAIQSLMPPKVNTIASPPSKEAFCCPYFLGTKEINFLMTQKAKGIATITKTIGRTPESPINELTFAIKSEPVELANKFVNIVLRCAYPRPFYFYTSQKVQHIHYSSRKYFQKSPSMIAKQKMEQIKNHSHQVTSGTAENCEKISFIFVLFLL